MPFEFFGLFGFVPIVFGVRPKTRHVGEAYSSVCPNCGSINSLQLVRTNEYFNLFYIPVARVRKGNLFLQCTACGYNQPADSTGNPIGIVPRRASCVYCKTIYTDPSFSFCPRDGGPLSPI